MVILDKNLKFVKWFNSKSDARGLKKGEFTEDDTAVPFVFCHGEKIVCMGHYIEKQIQDYLDLGYEMYDRDSFGWIDGETKHTQYNNNGKAKLKTAEMLLDEEKEKKKSEILNLTQQEQTALILNLNGEKETLKKKLKNIDDLKSIDEIKSIKKEV
jgi:hypothetical protein